MHVACLYGYMITASCDGFIVFVYKVTNVNQRKSLFYTCYSVFEGKMLLQCKLHIIILSYGGFKQNINIITLHCISKIIKTCTLNGTIHINFSLEDFNILFCNGELRILRVTKVWPIKKWWLWDEISAIA